MSNTTQEINWGYNCLTVGVHHGRPEAIWNIALLHATDIMLVATLQDLVTSRIYNDALQFVAQGELPRPSQQWADRVRELANDYFFDTFKSKHAELETYYDSLNFKNSLEGAVKRVKENTLNPGYQPLHSHDSINMLCRILGTTCSREASAEFPVQR